MRGNGINAPLVKTVELRSSPTFQHQTLDATHPQLHFRSHRPKFAYALIETTLEILRNIRIKRIRRRIRRHRAVTPMLVHPEPWGGIFPDNRLELVPASLRHFLERSARGKFNPGMKNHAVTPAGQRLARDVNKRRARALVQPHVRKGDTAFTPEALNRHGRQFRRNCQIDEQGETFAAAQGPIQMHDGAFAGCNAMAASLAQLQEDRIEQWILELLRDDDTFETGEGRDNAEPFEVAVMIATDNDRLARARVFLIPSLAILELNVTREIFTRQARAPKEIEHGAGKMLIGFTHDLGAALA